MEQQCLMCGNERSSVCCRRTVQITRQCIICKIDISDRHKNTIACSKACKSTVSRMFGILQRARNSVKINARRKEDRLRNREKIRIQKSNSYYRNLDRYQERERLYRENNKETRNKNAYERSRKGKTALRILRELDVFPGVKTEMSEYRKKENAKKRVLYANNLEAYRTQRRLWNAKNKDKVNEQYKRRYNAEKTALKVLEELNLLPTGKGTSK